MKNPFKREPDFHVGGKEDPYMLRWWLIPRNKYFNIYLHKFLRDDEDRATHGHPWKSLSIVLKGDYIEHRPIKFLNSFSGKIEVLGYEQEVFKRRSIIFRGADYYHRIELFKDKRKILIHQGNLNPLPEPQYIEIEKPRPVWTIFITGRKRWEWGFLCENKGFVHWRDFVHPEDHGDIGPGCGE